MAYGITITTKATVGGITDSFPLGAAVTGMTPGEQYTVQWANDKGIVFEHNDLPVIQSLDDGTVGTNSGTQMARATTAQAVKFTANLMYRGVKVKSSKRCLPVSNLPLTSYSLRQSDMAFSRR